LKISSYIQDSIVDGQGLRFALFTQGCPHHCAGCHNPGTHDPDGGFEAATADVISAMLSNPLTDGLTLSGGEPFAQAADCAEIAAAAKNAGLNVWAYSGWTFGEILGGAAPHGAELLRLCDVLVDGRFELSERSLSLKWRGSANQRLVDVQKSLASGEVVLWEAKPYVI